MGDHSPRNQGYSSVLLTSDWDFALASFPPDKSFEQLQDQQTGTWETLLFVAKCLSLHPKFKALTGRRWQMLSSIRADLLTLGSQRLLRSPPINSTGPSGAGHWGETALCVCLWTFVDVWAQCWTKLWEVTVRGIICKQTQGYCAFIAAAAASTCSFFLYLHAIQFRDGSLTIYKCVVWM